MKKYFTISTVLLLLALVNYTYAWIEPQNGQSISAPINTSSQAQTKQGQLNLQTGVVVNGNTVLSNNNLGTVSIGGQNSAGEGAEIDMLGTGGGNNLYFDNNSGNSRIFWVDANNHALQVFNAGTGKSSLYVENGINAGGNIFLSSDNAGTTYIGGQNSSGEGAEISMQGTGGGNTYEIDNISGNSRIFWGDANNHTLQVFNAGTGSTNMWVQGGIYTNGGFQMGSGQTIYSPGRMHIAGEENLYLLNKGGVYVSTAWGGNGNLSVDNAICLRGDCRGNWPTLVSISAYAGPGGCYAFATAWATCPDGYSIVSTSLWHTGNTPWQDYWCSIEGNGIRADAAGCGVYGGCTGLCQRNPY